jgi:hypothetical protein
VLIPGSPNSCISTFPPGFCEAPPFENPLLDALSCYNTHQIEEVDGFELVADSEAQRDITPEQAAAAEPVTVESLLGGSLFRSLRCTSANVTRQLCYTRIILVDVNSRCYHGQLELK